MRAKMKFIAFLLVIITVAVACSPAAEETLPTLAPEALASPQPPAVDTPVESSSTATPALPAATPTRFELPPTWTPTFTHTPSPTPTFTPSPEPVLPPTLPATCDTFAVDRERSSRTFNVGTSPLVAWTEAEGTLYYRLTVYNDIGMPIFEELVTETQYALPADLFEEGRRYGWQVHPVDQAGIQMCYNRGAELIPIVPR